MDACIKSAASMTYNYKYGKKIIGKGRSLTLLGRWKLVFEISLSRCQLFCMREVHPCSVLQTRVYCDNSKRRKHAWIEKHVCNLFFIHEGRNITSGVFTRLKPNSTQTRSTVTRTVFVDRSALSWLLQTCEHHLPHTSICTLLHLGSYSFTLVRMSP